MMVCDYTIFLTIVSGPNFPPMSGPLLIFCLFEDLVLKSQDKGSTTEIYPRPQLVFVVHVQFSSVL